MFENLNVAGELWKCTEDWLKKYHPNLLNNYKDIYFSENKFWDKMEEEIEESCKGQKIECRIYFHHKK